MGSVLACECGEREEEEDKESVMPFAYVGDNNVKLRESFTNDHLSSYRHLQSSTRKNSMTPIELQGFMSERR